MKMVHKFSSPDVIISKMTERLLMLMIGLLWEHYVLNKRQEIAIVQEMVVQMEPTLGTLAA